jgi:hypothetical protein
LNTVGYAALRDEQRRNRDAFLRAETRKLMGIGISFFTEIVGVRPIKNCDIPGVGMFDSCETRVHPTGSAIARLGTISQGQGHATTFAQILASEIGIPAANVTVEAGDTDTAPYGLGTYGSRSTPVAGAATAMAGRKIRAKARSSRPTCSRCTTMTSNGMSTISASKACRRCQRTRPSSPSPPTTTYRPAWSPNWKRSAITRLGLTAA